MATNLQALRAGVVALPDGPWLLEPRHGPGAHAFDPLRVTLLAAGDEDGGDDEDGGGGLGGFALDEALIERGVYAELPEAHTLTFALSAGTERADVRRLLRAMRRQAAGSGHRTKPRDGEKGGHERTRPWALAATQAQLAATYHAAGWGVQAGIGAGGGSVGGLTPREAHFCPRRTETAEAAVGRLSAETIAPYPPGIPVLFPGELITSDALAHLRAMRAAGCSITGCSDPELRTLAVLDV